MDSKKRMNDLRHKLYQFSNQLEDIYYKMKAEYEHELDVEDEYTLNYNKKLEEHFERVSNVELSRMIQDRLPIILKIFHVKAYVYSKSLDTNDSCIKVSYSFDKSNSGFKRFYYEFWVNDFE